MENLSTQLLARLASDINLHIVPFVESYRESNDKLNTILNKGIELIEDLKDIDPDVLYKVVAYVTNLVKFGISNQVNYKLLAEHCLFLKETIDSYLKQ